MNHSETKKLKLAELAILAGFLLSLLLTNFLGFSSECKSISQSVLRLHILANSDSEEDQQLKLKVRDRILSETGSLFESEGDLEAAEQDVKEHLEEIQAIAQDEVIKEGYTYNVHAELTNMFFHTRTYETVTLPAGRYDALRITIGKAEGHNWWCVLYPPLCVPAAEPEKEVNETLDEEQAKLVEQSPKYDVRFAIVDFWETIKDKLGW